MNTLKVSAVLWLGLFLTVVTAYDAPNPDEITSLPGLSTKLHFKQYSGYLNSTGTKKLHYWFVESEQNPSSDPLLLWMNGGPGCSSLFGLLGEHGPIHIRDDGRTAFVNPYRWNKHANILYLEAPAGVGFSYSADHNYVTDDDHVAEDNYVALQDFFSKYPEFKPNDFYITGESYGGIYVPTLSVKVLNGPADINFKGFVVGNGFMNADFNSDSLVFFGYHHGLISETLWDRLSLHCCHNNVSRTSCNFIYSHDADCITAVSEASHFINGINLNMYNLYSPCVTTTANSNSRYSTDRRLIQLGSRDANQRPIAETVPCVNDTRVSAWLNLPQTRRALHIPDNVQDWSECSTDVAGGYSRVYDTMKPQFQTLLSSGRVRGLVYNGDVDMACNFMGDQWFVEDLGLNVVTPWKQWTHLDQVAGFYKAFDKLTYLTVKGSGHMVPQDKPGEALEMISAFLNGKI